MGRNESYAVPISTKKHKKKIEAEQLPCLDIKYLSQLYQRSDNLFDLVTESICFFHGCCL